MKTLLFAILVIIFSCQNHEGLSQAQKLFLKASGLYKRNPTNKDSLKYVLTLLDSAIVFDANQERYYLTKCQIAFKLDNYDLAINSCDHVLKIDNNNFLATLTKGVAFELSNKTDSSTSIYRKTYNLLEKTKFQTELDKEYIRLILLRLLNDTLSFNLQMKEFEKRFKGDNQFDLFNNDLKHFDRKEYLDSY